MFRIITQAILTVLAFLSLGCSLWTDCKSAGTPELGLALSLAMIAVGVAISLGTACGQVSRLVDREMAREEK